MLRTKLLAATAVATLMATPALAQEATPPAQTTVPDAATTSAPSTMPAPAEAAPQAMTPAETETPAAGETVVDVLRASGQFSTLLSALDQAQLTETLSTRPAISIFAPTDAAFAALPEAERTRLMDPANANELRQVLLYHVIVADVTPDQIEGRKGGVPTASEAQILLDGTGDAIKADGATVVSAELDASNGAVFPIDKVLNPAQSMAAMGDEESAAATEATDASGDDAAAATTETTTPAEPGMTAPNGQPAATTTTVASPPVANPTDGQMDTPADPAVNPSATPPVQTPDAVDGEQEGDPTPQ